MQMVLLASERWFSIGLEKDQRDRLLFSARNVLFHLVLRRIALRSC
jgi:hypothetical protein